MTTATAQAAPNIAFIKYWGTVTENVAVDNNFANFLNSKTGQQAISKK